MRLKFLRAGLLGVVILGIALVSPATYYYHIYEALQTTTGEAITGATYFIYTADTTDTAAIYSDRAGTRNWQGSGETTGSDGTVDCYVLAGTYDIYYSHSGWNLSGTLEDFIYGVADSFGSQSVVQSDTLKPQTGRTIYGRAASGKDAGILEWARANLDTISGERLDYPRADLDTVRADNVYFYALDGDDSTTIYTQNLIVSGTLTGPTLADRVLMPFGFAAGVEKTLVWFNLAYDRHGSVYAPDDCQAPASRAASITGVYLYVDILKFDAPADTLTVSALKDDVVIFSTSSAVTATGPLHIRLTQAALLDTVNPASLLHMRLTATDTLTYAMPSGWMELTFTN